MATRTAASELSDLKNAEPAVPAARTRASTIEILNPGKNCSFEETCINISFRSILLWYILSCTVSKTTDPEFATRQPYYARSRTEKSFIG